MAVTAWRRAWRRANLGPEGFYRRTSPSMHFRTASTYRSALAPALVELLTRVDCRLGHPDPFDLVDVGAGDGHLVAAVADHLLRTADPAGLAPRLRPLAIDVRDRPDGLPATIAWVRGTGPAALVRARPRGVTGLLVAWEFLDDVACDIATHDGRRWHVLLVDPASGRESVGPAVDDAAACSAIGVDGRRLRDWLSRWWPRPRPGDRVEVGTGRDRAWAGLVAQLRAGTALAVDYAHPGAVLSAGTMAGYARGRRVDPVPDGSCNITAHVLLPACAAAAEAGGRVARTRITTQRAALRELGVDARPPGRPAPSTTTAEQLAALASAGAAAALLAPDGLGSFGWLEQTVRD